MYQTHKQIFICLFIVSLGYSLVAVAQEKIYIIADSSVYNYKTGVKVFEGHVKIDQGTTHLTADKLITKNNNHHKIQEAIAYGLQQPAHYWTLPKMGEPELHANADVIKFYPIDSKVTLEQHVTVAQGENSFKGTLIIYNMNDQTITVPASKDGRAVLVYNPDK